MILKTVELASSSVVDSTRTSSRVRRLVTSPNAVLAAACIVACLVLLLPISLTIGPSYWDVYQYYDAANRIFAGQVPGNDFFTPVGPLGYYVFAGWLAVFPNGQPALLAQWSTLILTAPMMALVLSDVSKRSRATAFALLLPFLLFALLPFNTHEYYPFPGTDAFGTYNRQVCQLLYVLLSGIMFMRNRTRLTWVIALGMSALFFIKITGFLAGCLLTGYAFLAGRLRMRNLLAAVAAFALLLVAIQVTTGLVSSYVGDIVALVGINSASLAPRFLQATSVNFGILVCAGLLASTLLWLDRQMLASATRSASRMRSAARASAILDHPGCWLLVTLAAGVFSETQNYGSQALIFLWPVCLRVLIKIRRFKSRPVVMVAVVTLAAAAMLPPAVAVAERAGRAFVGSLKNMPLASRNLKSLGTVNMRPDVALRVEHMMDFYPKHRAAYQDMIAIGELPTPLLFSDSDFQAVYLASVDQAIDAIRQLEDEKGIHFETIMSINNYNPFPYLMDRTAPRAVSIAADPMRTVQAPGSVEQRAISDADLVLYPTCPPTATNAKLLEMYAKLLDGHRRVSLSDCFDTYVNPRFDAKLGG
ncbi:MAG: rane protein [Mycobacterium sp.]|nr:rane protein [Mycobacterium sp.]